MALTISTLPTPPNSGEPSTFNLKADNLLGALPLFVTEANALANQVEGFATAAETSATNSANSAANANTQYLNTVAAINAVQWQTSPTGVYSVGQLVWSPIDYRIYRNKTGTNSTTDPSNDATRWGLVFSWGFTTSIQTGSFTAAASTHYFLTGGSAQVVTLPNTGLLDGKTIIGITVCNNLTSNSVNPNGSQINGMPAGDVLVLDNVNATIQLIYVNSTVKWRIIKGW